jgi:hypothetical protein
MAKVGVGSAAGVVLEAIDDDKDDRVITGVGVVVVVLRAGEEEVVFWTEDTLVDVSPADKVDRVVEASKVVVFEATKE